MINRVLLLVIIASFYILKSTFYKGGDVKYLFVSFFITITPFEFNIPLSSALYQTPGGTLGNVFFINVPLILLCILSPLIKDRIPIFQLLKRKWILLILGLVLISFLNPYNQSKLETCIFLYFFLTNVLLFIVFSSILSKEEIIKGIYDGLMVLCLLQFLLALCFPLMHIAGVTKLFRLAADEWSTRNGTREGAVGIFVAPGNLALFVTLASTYFYSCFLTKFKTKTSLLLCIVNAGTVVLTYSRTSYLTYIFVLFSLYFIFSKKDKNLFSFANFLKFVTVVAGVLVWLIYFSPLSDAFLKSDADDMFAARMVHFTMAFYSFKVSPVIGVGLNAHLEYFSRNFSLFKEIPEIDEFFLNNPIHNIHLIILVETGIIGFFLWVSFIVSNFRASLASLASNKNQVLSLTLIGFILTYVIYGSTGWAPFSPSILPIFLFMVFFTIQYRDQPDFQDIPFKYTPATI